MAHVATPRAPFAHLDDAFAGSLERVVLHLSDNPDVRFVRMFGSCESARKARILVVDDNKDAVEALSTLLEWEGFAVATAQNGSDALKKLSNEGISVILLDLWMPVMMGISSSEGRRRKHHKSR